MKLIKFDKSHLAEIMEWFPDGASIAIWGGPGFRFPFTEQSFLTDLDLSNTVSFVLTSDLGSSLAFGQYYMRNERCHLSRLVVSPSGRGNGVGKHLIAQLCLQGCDDLKVSGCSLFVMSHNKSAVRLYLSLGFRNANCPEEISKDMIYMVRSSDRE